VFVVIIISRSKFSIKPSLCFLPVLFPLVGYQIESGGAMGTVNGLGHIRSPTIFVAATMIKGAG